MGFRQARTTFALSFANSPYEGLEIKARAVSMEKFMAMQKLGGLALAGKVGVEEQVDANDDIVKDFVSCLVSWNLEEEDGTAVPTTVEGLLSQDALFVNAVIAAWMEGQAAVSDPLARSSSGGSSSQALSDLTEDL